MTSNAARVTSDRRFRSGTAYTEPWIDDLLANLYALACARPAVARLIGIWIAEALDRK